MGSECPHDVPVTSILSLPKRLVIFDLDGVVYRGDAPTPGAAEAITRLVSCGYQVRFLTNNSSRSRDSYHDKLAGMGIDAAPEQVMTSAFATAIYLRTNGFEGRRALVVGEMGLVDELRSAGIDALPAGETFDGAPVAAVVVGIDRFFTYERLLQAQQAIVAGAEFIATNADPTFPTESGEIPGGGAILAGIQVSSGRQPLIIGKPNTYTLGLLLRDARIPRSEAVLVGDRLDTDISVGRQADLETILTLTGVTRREDAEQAPPNLRPNAIIRDLRDLEGLLTDGGRRVA